MFNKYFTWNENLKRFFTNDEIKIMSEAVYDHRASLEGEPRIISCWSRICFDPS